MSAMENCAPLRAAVTRPLGGVQQGSQCRSYLLEHPTHPTPRHRLRRDDRPGDLRQQQQIEVARARRAARTASLSAARVTRQAAGSCRASPSMAVMAGSSSAIRMCRRFSLLALFPLRVGLHTARRRDHARPSGAGEVLAARRSAAPDGGVRIPDMIGKRKIPLHEADMFGYKTLARIFFEWINPPRSSGAPAKDPPR
jgi:hypothetical protein